MESSRQMKPEVQSSPLESGSVNNTLRMVRKSSDGVHRIHWKHIDSDGIYGSLVVPWAKTSTLHPSSRILFASKTFRLFSKKKSPENFGIKTKYPREFPNESTATPCLSSPKFLHRNHCHTVRQRLDSKYARILNLKFSNVKVYNFSALLEIRTKNCHCVRRCLSTIIHSFIQTLLLIWKKNPPWILMRS